MTHVFSCPILFSVYHNFLRFFVPVLNLKIKLKLNLKNKSIELTTFFFLVFELAPHGKQREERESGKEVEIRPELADRV